MGENSNINNLILFTKKPTRKKYSKIIKNNIYDLAPIRSTHHTHDFMNLYVLAQIYSSAGIINDFSEL